jgi:hypothetical protein
MDVLRPRGRPKIPTNSPHVCPASGNEKEANGHFMSRPVLGMLCALDSYQNLD